MHNKSLKEVHKNDPKGDRLCEQLKDGSNQRGVSSLATKKKKRLGQTTTEYVLLLLFVVLAVRFAGKTIQDRLKNLLTQAFDKADTAVKNAEEQ